MSRRRQTPALSPEQLLRDAQDEFIQAVYRFRAAEAVNAPELIALKREMDHLDRQVLRCIRSFYSGRPMGQNAAASFPHNGRRCPKPAWI